MPPPHPSSSDHGPLAAINDAARLRKVHPTGDLAPLATLLAAPATRTAAIPLVGAWKLQPLPPSIVLLASDPATPAADRTAAFTSLHDLGSATVIAELRRLARESAPSAVRREAVVALAGTDLPQALAEIFNVLAATPAPRLNSATATASSSSATPSSSASNPAAESGSCSPPARPIAPSPSATSAGAPILQRQFPQRPSNRRRPRRFFSRSSGTPAIDLLRQTGT